MKSLQAISFPKMEKFLMKMEMNRNNIFVQANHIFISKDVTSTSCLLIHFFGYQPGYDVHHKNEIKTDNRLVNLMYLTRADHLKLHKTGKKFSEVIKQKIRKSCKKSSHKKPVYCLQLDKIFESIIQAARELNLSDGNICKCCHGKLKTTGKFHFEYFN